VKASTFLAWVFLAPAVAAALLVGACVLVDALRWPFGFAATRRTRRAERAVGLNHELRDMGRALTPRRPR